jgi:hypothetical protein
MGVSMVIGGSADNTNANAARIARNASAGESRDFGQPASIARMCRLCWLTVLVF